MLTYSRGGINVYIYIYIKEDMLAYIPPKILNEEVIIINGDNVMPNANCRGQISFSDISGGNLRRIYEVDFA